MPIELTDRFRAAYLGLPAAIQRKVQKAIRLLNADPRHPSLQTKPIQGAPGIYEARADQKYRMTYERRGDILILRNVGSHDQTLGKP